MTNTVLVIIEGPQTARVALYDDDEEVRSEHVHPVLSFSAKAQRRLYDVVNGFLEKFRGSTVTLDPMLEERLATQKLLRLDTVEINQVVYTSIPPTPSRMAC